MKKAEDVVTHVWRIDSFDDVKRLWSGVRSVPGRTQGREHFHEERYYLGLYLLALGTHGQLPYPLQVEEGESPDFVLIWRSGEATGLEVTRATTQWLQRAMTEDESEYLCREAAAIASGETPEPVSRSLSDGGWIGDEAEAEWCLLVRQAVERKIRKLPGFRSASRYDLLVYDDTPVGGIDRRKVVATLYPWVRSLDATIPKLGTVSVVISLDVLFDLSGRPRVLPYIETDDLSDLPERIEYAGWHAAKRALRAHVKAHNPVYSMDSRGRLVKQTPDGQRLEVRVAEDGAEIVLGTLSRE